MISVLVVSPPVEVADVHLRLLEQVAPMADRGVQLTLGTSAKSALGQAWLDRGYPLHDLDVRPYGSPTNFARITRQSNLALVSTAADVADAAAHAVVAAATFARATAATAMAAGRFDVLYSFAEWCHLEAAIAGRLRGVPTVLQLAGEERSWVGRRVVQAAADLAQLSLASSTVSGSALAARTKPNLILPGVDLVRFNRSVPKLGPRRELSGGTERPLVAMVGDVGVGTGLQIAVKALALGRGPLTNARLIVVGRAGAGAERFAEVLQAESERLLGDRVLFLDDRSDLPQIIGAVDVVVDASADGPRGLAVPQAQAMGTPVVVARAGKATDMVEHEVTGLLVPPSDAFALAAAVERLLVDRVLAGRLTTKALAEVHAHRGMESEHEELAKAFRSRVAGRR